MNILSKGNVSIFLAFLSNANSTRVVFTRIHIPKPCINDTFGISNGGNATNSLLKLKNRTFAILIGSFQYRIK